MPFINMGPSLNPYGPPMQGPPDPNLAQDPQIPPPDDKTVRGPFAAPGGPRTGNQVTDGEQEPSFAGSGYSSQNVEPAIQMPPQPESGNTAQPRPGDTEAIQAPKLTPPRRDFMSIVGRALLSSPHALGRALGGILAGGSLADQQANQQAEEDFKNQAQAKSLQELIKQRQAIEGWRQAQANALNTKAETPAPAPKNYTGHTVRQLPDGTWHDIAYDVTNPKNEVDMGVTGQPGSEKPPADKQILPQLVQGTNGKSYWAYPGGPVKEIQIPDEASDLMSGGSGGTLGGKTESNETPIAVAKTLPKPAPAPKGPADSTKLKLADLDNNIAQIDNIVQKAQALQRKHPGQVGGKLTGMIESGKYKAGFAGDPDYTELLPLLSAFRAYATGPLLHGIRNQKIVAQIQQHMPSGTDSPELMLDKARTASKLLKQLRSEEGTAVSVPSETAPSGQRPSLDEIFQ